MRNKSSADHGIGLEWTSPMTSKSLVDSEIGLSTTIKLPAGDHQGQDFVQDLYRSMVATIGSSINLSCSTDNQETPFWDYYPYSHPQHITIYNGGQHREDLDQRFVLDTEGCRASKCRLMIRNLQLTDAGHFVCLQPHSASRHLTLTVLGRYTIKVRDVVV